MVSNWNKEHIEETVNKLMGRASKDEDFRALCRSDIHAAIKEVSGNETPRNFKINVVDNTGYHLGVTLPPFKRESGELSESELESVAGGSKIEDDLNWLLDGLNRTQGMS